MSTLYRPIGSLPVIVRVPLRPASMATAAYGHESLDSIVYRALADPVISAALLVASPALYHALVGPAKGRLSGSHRALESAFRYIVRMATRSTPFGLFSAVSAIRMGGNTNLRVRGNSRAVHARIDRGLIAQLVSAIEKRHDLRTSLLLFPNDFIKNRGKIQITYSCSRSSPSMQSQLLQPTQLIQSIRDLARNGIAAGTLRNWIADNMQIEQSMADITIDQLLDRGVLVSDLWSSMVRFEDGTVLSKWAEQSISHATAVSELTQHLSNLNNTPVQNQCNEAYETAIALAKDAFGDSKRYLQVDSVISLDGTIRERIVAEACLIAEFFLRSSRPPNLVDAANEFLARYEGDSLVPLVDLAGSSIIGRSKLGSPQKRIHDYSGEGHFRLMRMISDAVIRNTNINLTCEEFRALLNPCVAEEFPGAVEIGFEVAASSIEDIERGEYLIVPSAFGVVTGIGRSSGRFLHLLPNQTEALRQWYNAPQPELSAIQAELAFNPSVPQLAGVLASQRVLTHQLQVGVHDRDGVCSRMGPGDIYVGLRNHRFFLWSKSLEREVVLQRHDLLAVSHLGSDVLTFLAALHLDGTRWASKLSLGDADQVPYVPRISIGRVVLSPRRWTVEAFGPNTDFETWRTTYNVPRFIRLVEGLDQTLLVDVETGIGREQLDLALKRASRSESSRLLVEEAIGAESPWLHGEDGLYAAEFVASVALRNPSSRLQHSNPRRTHYPSDERAKGPDDGWLFFKIFCDAEVQSWVLCNLMEPLRTELELKYAVKIWFFVRYAIPRAHMRIRLYVAESKARGECAAMLWRVLSDAVKKNLIDDVQQSTYQQEIERYGGLEGMALAESVFTLDSLWVTRALAVSDNSDRELFEAVRQAYVLLSGLLGRDDLRIWFQRPWGNAIKLNKDEWSEIRRLKEGISSSASFPYKPQLDSMRERLYAIFPTTREVRGKFEFLDSIVHMHFNRYGISDRLEQRARTALWHLGAGVEARSQVEVVL